MAPRILLCLVLLVSGCRMPQWSFGAEQKTAEAERLLNRLKQGKHCAIGAFVDDLSRSGDTPLLTTVQDLKQFEKLAGRPVALVNFFQALSYAGKPYDYPAAAMNEFKRYGAIPVVTLEPWDWDPKHPNHSRSLLPDILAGRWDPWIDKMAAGLKNYPGPILLRWAHEMNGDWYPWSGVSNQANSRLYIETWRYVHRRMDKVGAHNLLWVFCPNSNSVPNAEWNQGANYYPGDAYVDIIGVDTYNFGPPEDRSFAQTINEFYATYQKHWSNKPLIIPEIGVANVAANPELWITETFTSLKKSYPKVHAVLWFHMNNKKNQDFRIDRTPTLVKAYRQATNSSYFDD